MAGSIRVHNVAEVNAALRRFDTATRAGIVRDLAKEGRPVAQGSQALALGRIRNMPRSPQWATFRVGVTRNAVYVVPRQRGRKKGPQKRRNVARLILNRAMIPALRARQPVIVAKAQAAISANSRRFNRGGF